MKSTDVLHTCKRMLDMSLPVKFVSNVLDVCRQTVWRWFLCDFERVQRRGRKSKLLPCHQKLLCDFVCDHPCTTLLDVSVYAKQTFDVDVSQSTISRLLKQNNITRKKGTTCFIEQRQADVQKFVSEIPSNAYQTWSSLDEASFTLNLSPLYGYGKKGRRVVIPRPGSRGTRLSLLLYISPRHPPSYELLKGGVKSDRFQSFLSRLPNHDTIVLDNASIHHAKASLSRQQLPSIEETSKSNHQTLKYLPAYSPQLNPTELVFNVLRQHVRKVSPRSETCLMNTIESKLNSMSFAGFFRHCWKSAISM